MATTRERSQSLKSPETRGTQDAIFPDFETELSHQALKILLAGWLAILVALFLFLGGISAFGSQDPAGFPHNTGSQHNPYYVPLVFTFL